MQRSSGQTRHSLSIEAEDNFCARVLLASACGLHSSYNAKAVSKFDAIERAVCADGRLHGMFMFYGAGPGRWSSTIVQLQNLMRPVISETYVLDNAAPVPTFASVERDVTNAATTLTAGGVIAGTSGGGLTKTGETRRSPSFRRDRGC